MLEKVFECLLLRKSNGGFVSAAHRADFCRKNYNNLSKYYLDLIFAYRLSVLSTHEIGSNKSINSFPR